MIVDRIHLCLRHLSFGTSFDLLNLRLGFVQLLAGLQS
jgi:hypothetical protein